MSLPWSLSHSSFLLSFLQVRHPSLTGSNPRIGTTSAWKIWPAFPFLSAFLKSQFVLSCIDGGGLGGGGLLPTAGTTWVVAYRDSFTAIILPNFVKAILHRIVKEAEVVYFGIDLAGI